MKRKIDHSDEELTRVLRQVLKKDSAEFQKIQYDIVRAILDGRDLLAILPTGTGKSVCFQVPAMLLPGVTLVISPLIALIQEQAERLHERGFPVACLSSEFILDRDGPHPLRRRKGSEEDFEESAKARALRDNIFLDATRCKYKIIYLTPERLRTGPFIRFAQHAEISMIAVDEAHCISLWGYDFRPRYLEISRLMKRIGYHPVVAAFTATATNSVRKDIIEYLGMKNPVEFGGSHKRDNLTFSVWNKVCEDPVHFDEEGRSTYRTYPAWFRRRLNDVAAYLRRHPEEHGVISCPNADYADQVCRQLALRSLPAALYDTEPYTDEEAREKNNRENLEAFRSGKTKVIVSAPLPDPAAVFDREDIRFVIHFSLPESLEDFCRQTNCAGRDGAVAQCILCCEGAEDAEVVEAMRRYSSAAGLSDGAHSGCTDGAQQDSPPSPKELINHVRTCLGEYEAKLPPEERTKRDNLRFTVWNGACKSTLPVVYKDEKDDEKHKYPRSFWFRLNSIAAYLRKCPKKESGFIYCPTVDYVNQVYRMLEKSDEFRGRVTRYYAELDKDKENKKPRESKKGNMADFLSGKKRIMVSTSALGMGIDKNDIRYVIHFGLPNCMEDYYQQAGRAGRDGKPARCILCYAGKDDLRICKTLNKFSRFETELGGGAVDILEKTAEQRLERMDAYGQMHGCPSRELEAYILDYFDCFEPDIPPEQQAGWEANIRHMIRQVDVLYVNRTKIAQELRKGLRQGTDMVVGDDRNGAAPTVSYSVEGPELSYFDLMVADAVYTLMKHRVPTIYARNVMELLSGVDGLTLRTDKMDRVKTSIRKLMQTQLTIDRRKSMKYGFVYDDEQGLTVLRDAFLPLEEKEEKRSDPEEEKRSCFIYDPNRLPPLYQYAEILNGQFFSLPMRELRKVFGRTETAVGTNDAQTLPAVTETAKKNPEPWELLPLPTSAENLAIVHYVLCRIGSMNKRLYNQTKSSEKKEPPAGASAPAEGAKEKARRTHYAFTAPVIHLDTMVNVLQIDKLDKLKRLERLERKKEKLEREGKTLQIEAPKDPKEKYSRKRRSENLWVKMQAAMWALKPSDYYRIDGKARIITLMLFKEQRENNKSAQESSGSNSDVI